MAKLCREALVKKLVSKQVLIAKLRRKITYRDSVISKLRLMISKIVYRDSVISKLLRLGAQRQGDAAKIFAAAAKIMNGARMEVAGTKGLGTKGAGTNIIRASAHEAIKPCTCYRTLVGDQLPCPWCNNLSKVRF